MNQREMFAPSFFDHLSDRLELALYDTKQELQTRRLAALYRELEPMKIRITEPVFFQGADRKPGDELDVQDGPWRKVPPASFPSAYGYDLVPQFEKIDSLMTDAPVPPASTATFAAATAAILKPTQPVKPATKPATVAGKLSDLAKQRIAFNKELSADVDAYAVRMTEVKTKKADVFTKAHAVLDDEIAGLGSVDDSLTEFEGANGGPLSG